MCLQQALLQSSKQIGGDAHRDGRHHASTSLIGRFMTKQFGITRHNLKETTMYLMGTNSGQIKLDRSTFLNLTLGDHKSSQLVYVTAKVAYLFLSQRACKELPAVHTNFTFIKQWIVREIEAVIKEKITDSSGKSTTAFPKMAQSDST